MSQCQHAYWHASQCPFCELARVRRELLIVRLHNEMLRRAHDEARGEVARMKVQRYEYQKHVRRRKK
ncbi:MAG: hypothetical protein KA200_00060 [Burkholderiales bacterium]|nr:hypothetical protein [Burkholderiales bacterium]